MGNSFERQDLYEKVWTEPLKILAPKLGVSDVALAKACRKACIPLPGRGHWAKKRAGKPSIQIPLPLRFPGANNTIDVGYRHYSHAYHEIDLLNDPLPAPPSFEEDIDSLRERITKMVGKVRFPHTATETHPIIQIFLEQDEHRRIDYEEKGYTWNKPLFDSSIEKRRLRILNAIFLATHRLGCKPSMATSSYEKEVNRAASITVGSQSVNFTLCANKAKKAIRNNAHKTNDILRLSIQHPTCSTNIRYSWEDTAESRLESLLKIIVEEIILAGEYQYREACQSHYEWLVKYRAELKEEARQTQLRKERESHELLEMQEQQRVEKLLGEATALQHAITIRQYVATIQSKKNEIDAPKDDIDKWARWALAKADKIDPIKNLSFLDIGPQLHIETNKDNQ